VERKGAWPAHNSLNLTRKKIKYSVDNKGLAFKTGYITLLKPQAQPPTCTDCLSLNNGASSDAQQYIRAHELVELGESSAETLHTGADTGSQQIQAACSMVEIWSMYEYDDRGRYRV